MEDQLLLRDFFGRVEKRGFLNGHLNDGMLADRDTEKKS